MSIGAEPGNPDVAQAIQSANAVKDVYYRKHAACPKCGGKDHPYAVVGYPVVMSEPKEYKDENEVRCKCGWTGIVDDLVEAKA